MNQLIKNTGWTCLAAAMTSASATAQCNQWLGVPGMSGGVNTAVLALTRWDPDGPGPLATVLVAGGEFTMAGATPANNIAAWDGTVWAPLGIGIVGEVSALAVLPDGHLIAAGTFTHAGGVPCSNIAQWDGASWSPLGTGTDNTIWALTVDGTCSIAPVRPATAALTASAVTPDGSWEAMTSPSASSVERTSPSRTVAT